MVVIWSPTLQHEKVEVELKTAEESLGHKFYNPA
jgi:hypothetical protein